MIRRTRLLRAIVAAGVLAAGSGCAYYNTLYNANLKFDEAQDIKRRADPERPKITNQEERLYDEALEKAAKVVKYHPGSKWVDDALLLMGKSAFEKGEYATANRKFQEILTLYPNSDLATAALLWKGRTDIATRDYTAGVEALRRATEKEGKKFRPDVRYFLGVVSEDTGDEEEALGAYFDILKNYRKSEWFADAGMRAGALCEERGEYDRAIEAYERVWKKAGLPEDRYRAGMHKGDAQIAVGDWRGARKTYRQVGKGATDEEDRAEALVKVGKALASGGQWEEAESTFLDVIQRFPRREAAAQAQFEIAAKSDHDGDLETAIAQYDLVKEQGTGHPAWQEASARMTEIQRVIDLRTELAEEDVTEPERKRFLLAEQLLENIGDVDAALAEYDRLAVDAAGTEWGSRARYAEAWVLEHRLDRPDSANALLFRLANFDPHTEVGKAARLRLGYPVWNAEDIEEQVEFIRPAGQEDQTIDVVVNRVNPVDLPLPPGEAEVKVWVRVTVGENGEPTAAKVAKSAGEPFDTAALDAARASSYLRPDQGGPPITVVQYVWPLPASRQAAGADDEPSAAERDAMLNAAPNSSVAPGLSGAAADSTNMTSAPGTASALPDSAAVQPTPRRVPPFDPKAGLRDRDFDSATGD
ncbi:MAG: TonB family protein [bacterium]